MPGPEAPNASVAPDLPGFASRSEQGTPFTYPRLPVGVGARARGSGPVPPARGHLGRSVGRVAGSYPAYSARGTELSPRRGIASVGTTATRPVHALPVPAGPRAAPRTPRGSPRTSRGGPPPAASPSRRRTPKSPPRRSGPAARSTRRNLSPPRACTTPPSRPSGDPWGSHPTIRRGALFLSPCSLDPPCPPILTPRRASRPSLGRVTRRPALVRRFYAARHLPSRLMGHFSRDPFSGT